MTNMEKYTATKDALEAYKAWLKKDIVGLSFYQWLDYEYVEYVAPREPTLIEAAEAFLTAYHSGATDGGYALEEAIGREKRKPRRNLDVYATAKDAYEAYETFCSSRRTCDDCKYKGRACMMAWLYAKADAKEAK